MARGIDENKKNREAGTCLRDSTCERRGPAANPVAGHYTADHHVRCYKGKATENYLLFNKRGIEFIGLDPNQPATPNRFQWVRGTCRYGILPSNGLIYAPPHACACYPGAKVDGFLALADGERVENREPRRVDRRRTPEARPGLPRRRIRQRESRPSQFGAEQATLTASSSWPTYRGDNRRSGHAPTSVPADLAVAWEVKPGVKLSSPGGGRRESAYRCRRSIHGSCLGCKAGRIALDLYGWRQDRFAADHP